MEVSQEAKVKASICGFGVILYRPLSQKHSAFLTKAERLLADAHLARAVKKAFAEEPANQTAVPQVYAPVPQRKIEIDVGRHIEIAGSARDEDAEETSASSSNAECLSKSADQCENVAKACAEKHVDGVETCKDDKGIRCGDANDGKVESGQEVNEQIDEPSMTFSREKMPQRVTIEPWSPWIDRSENASTSRPSIAFESPLRAWKVVDTEDEFGLTMPVPKVEVPMSPATALFHVSRQSGGMEGRSISRQGKRRGLRQ